MPITIAEMFAAQSVLCVDEPDGEYTSGTPLELMQWAQSKMNRSRMLPLVPGKLKVTDVIEFDDDSNALVQWDGVNRIRVADAAALPGPIDAEHDPEDPAWGIISHDPLADIFVPSDDPGRAYIRSLKQLLKGELDHAGE